MGAGAWLEVLRNLVTAMQIPHRIVIGKQLDVFDLRLLLSLHVFECLICCKVCLTALLLAGGTLTRAQQQDRIDFLASARNRALEPLWLNTTFPGMACAIFSGVKTSWVSQVLKWCELCS